MTGTMWAGHEGQLSDMLSTAIFVMGAERGRSLLTDIPGAQLILIGTDGRVIE